MKSFTLVEILVTIAVISILSVVLIPNYHMANNKMALERSAYKIARDLRYVQEMAMSSRGAFNSSYFPEGGYGIDFSENNASVISYILFADCDNDKTYSMGGAVTDCRVGLNSIEKVEELFLESGVEIDPNGTYKLKKIIFSPPDPSVEMSPNPNSNPGVTLVSTKGDFKDLYVITNIAGRIEIISEP